MTDVDVRELTIAGVRGELQIEIDDGDDVVVGEVLAAVGLRCTRVEATVVDEAIQAGQLRLVDGDQVLSPSTLVSEVRSDRLLVDYVPEFGPVAEVSKEHESAQVVSGDARSMGDQSTIDATDDSVDPEPDRVSPEKAAPPATASPASPSAARAAATAGQPAPPATSARHWHAGTPAIVLPTRLSAFARLSAAYKALADGHPRQANGLPPQPPLTRARQAWRRSGHLNTLIRGIAAPELTECVVVAFLASKGGVGKTTSAKLVAMAFAEARRDRCVLIDANPDRGTLGTTFARGHTTYVDDVWRRSADPSLTPSDLDAMLANGPHGLRVLPAPQNSARRRQLGEEAYTAVIDCLRRNVGIVVVDFGTDMLEGPTVAALKAAHQLVVVADDDWVSGEQTAASFWDDVRTTSRAEYTVIANKIRRRRRRSAAEQVHQQLTQTPGADAHPRSVSVVTFNSAAAKELGHRTVEWADLPRQWQRTSREVTYRLAADWTRLGIAHSAISPSET